METRQVVARINTQTMMAVLIKTDKTKLESGTEVYFPDHVKQLLNMVTVHKDDIPKINMLMDAEKFRERCERHENGTLLCFRAIVNGKILWYRLVISIPEDYSEKNPEILFACRRMATQEADMRDAHRAMGARIIKVIKCNLADNTYRVIKLQKSEEYLRPKYSLARCAAGEHLVEEEFVHKDDLEEFHRETNYNSVISYFAMGNSEKVMYYRRKSGNIYKWVKMVILKASEYTEDNPVFLYFILNVHRSLTRLLIQRDSPKGIDKYKVTRSGINLYYDTLIHALTFLTQKYIDFYVIDLERDQYIKYKIDRAVLEGTTPYVGSYSGMMDSYINQNLKGSDAEVARLYDTSEKLRNVLTDKLAIEFPLTNTNGDKVNVICTRSESIDGVPTKVIMRMVPLTEPNRMRVKTFGSFEVYDSNGSAIEFTKKKSKQLLAYLIDKYGYSVATSDIVEDVLEKSKDDLNAVKYVSALFRSAVKDLEKAGYNDIIIKEWNSMRVNIDKLDCDYYHLMEGDTSCLVNYHNEYMKQYSWAEETNAEILHIGSQ